MVRFSIDCTLPFSATDFWRIRDSPSFIRFIVSDGMLKKMTVTPPVPESPDADDGWMTRKQHYCPARVDCPDVVRSIVGDTMFDVVDEQRWNDRERPCHLHFTIKPSFLASLSSTHGELSVEALPHDDETSEDEGTALRLAKSVRDISLASSSDDDDDSEKSNSARPTTRRPRHQTHQQIRDSEQQRSENMSDTSGGDAGCDEADDAETGSSISDTPAEDQNATAIAVAAAEEDPLLAIEALPAREKSRHVVKGVTRVRILTVGWFVERAIVHNLRKFYETYPATVLRFRHLLYERHAGGDHSVPVSVVVDRFLAAEEVEAKADQERLEQKDETTLLAEHERSGNPTAESFDSVKVGPPSESGELSSVTTTTDSPQSDCSDGFAE